jgi:hypothetical protein
MTMKKLILLFLPVLLAYGRLWAQMPNDGLLMPAKNWCTMLQASDSRWSEYWEGRELRSNDNLGTFINQSVMLMSNYGINDNLNVMVALPWVRTEASASYLSGQQGIQDLSLWLKWQFLKRKFGNHTLSLQTTGGVSSPLTNYPADFQPFSIGMHSRTASLRAIVHFSLANGLYATAQGGHSWRAKVEIDREAYLYDNELVYDNQALVPNVVDATFRLGYLSKKIQAEAWFDYNSCLSGDDIRYNDMPLLTNYMQRSAAGLMLKYWMGPFAVSVGGNQVLAGRNMGKARTLQAAIFYQFKLKNTKN